MTTQEEESQERIKRLEEKVNKLYITAFGLLCIVLIATALFCVFILLLVNDVNNLSRCCAGTRENKVFNVVIDETKMLKSYNEDEPIRQWRSTGTLDFVSFDHETITVQVDGTYLVYVQITFDAVYGKLSFAVCLDGEEFIKCTWAESGIESPWVYPCHTSKAKYLRAGQQLSVKTSYDNSSITAVSSMTYWGVVYLN